MGTTAPVRCESCTQVTEVELKDVAIDEPRLLISFDFTCAQCGFAKNYASLTLEQAAELTSTTDKAKEMAALTGLSVERMRTYVYPPDVMAKADLDRRKIPSSSVKAELKASRQAYPSEKAGWWRVYVMESRGLNVWYFPETHQYRLHVEGGAPQLVADAVALGDLLFKRFAVAT
jgi:hypothetical protein